MTATEQVILVDENDQPIGTAEKLAAHRNGLLHRAFSVFILRHTPKIELLLQQRADHKYHSPGLWTNTCCSHPHPEENIISAAERRLQEEMGFSTTLQLLGWFHYIAHFNNGLTENEIDHVLIGTMPSTKILPNKAEVKDYRWITIDTLKAEIRQNPDAFTPWLGLALELVLAKAV